MLMCLPALEDNEISVTGPADVRVMGRLLHMLRGKGVGPLELEPGVHLVQTLDGGVELLLVEHSEHGQDVLLHQQVQGGFPELKHTLSVKARVDSHGNIWHLYLLCSDPSKNN